MLSLYKLLHCFQAALKFTELEKASYFLTVLVNDDATPKQMFPLAPVELCVRAN